MDLFVSSNATAAPCSRPRASLSTLPPELKRVIVDEAADFVQSSSLKGNVQRGHLERQIKSVWYEMFHSPLRALSMVSREFAALAEGHLWEHVSIKTTSPTHLIEFLIDVLPRHAHHVRYLHIPAFRLQIPVPSLRIPFANVSGSNTTAAAIVLGRPLAFVVDPAILLQLSQLLGRAIGGMARLVGVCCAFRQLLGASVLPIFRKELRTCNAPVALAMEALGSRLRDLEIYSDGDTTASRDESLEVATFTRFLSHFPSLLRLAIHIPGLGRIGDQSLLLSTISSFRHLAALDVKLSDFGRNASKTCWASSLVSLSMPEPHDFPLLATVLNNFAATLMSLTIYQGPNEPWHVTPPTPLLKLPHLRHLVVFTSRSCQLVDYFLSCPLTHIKIYSDADLSFSAGHHIVDRLAATLESVTIGVSAYPSLDLPLTPLETLFQSKGIVLFYEVQVDSFERAPIKMCISPRPQHSEDEEDEENEWETEEEEEEEDEEDEEDEGEAENEEDEDSEDA